MVPIRWLVLGSVAVAWSCGGAQVIESPILTLQQLPNKRLSLVVDRGETGQGDIGPRVTVTVNYDTGNRFCGTLRSPAATLGGVSLPLLTAGQKRPDFDGGTDCEFPTFQLQLPPGATGGPLEVTDGLTTARMEFDVLDPDAAALTFPADGILRPGESARWHLTLPAGHGLRSYRVYADFTVADWVQGIAADASGDVVAPLPPSVPANGSVTGELNLLWNIDANVVSCSAGYTCEIASSGLAGARISIQP